MLYVTKLVPRPYQLFLPNQTTRTPSSFNMKSMSKEREKNRVILKLGRGKVGGGVHFKNSYRQGGVQISYEIILGGYSFHTPHIYFWSTFTSVTTRKKVNRKFCSHNIFHPGKVLKGLRRCHNNILKTI